MKFYKIEKSSLVFNENVPKINLKIKLPLLIDKKRNVLMGNGQRDLLDSRVIVAVYGDAIDFAKETFWELDEELCSENNASRLLTLQNEIQEFIIANRATHEQSSLFDFKETRMISEENYQRTPEYDYSKKNKKKEEDDLDMSMLLSVFEEKE